MNSFILKGNICYSISKTKLKTLSGYVVCRDGKCAGVFEEIPDKYKDLELRDLKDKLIIPGMLHATKMKVHIAVSAIGLVLLVGYTIATKKEWKCPALEILQRVCYGIALITGVVLMNVHGIAVVSIVHKISAVLFVILLAIAEIHKATKK